MSAVFLDTVGLLALFDVRDRWHAPAVRAWSEIVTSGDTFVTTPSVLMECANPSARRPYRKAVAELRDALIEAGMIIDSPENELEQAWRNYAHGGVGGAGLVDQLSFLVMRRCRMARAFSNDRHFTAAGFQTLF